MRSEQRPYDAVFSLGQWCATAIYLKKHGLRSFSGPFDWVGPNPELPTYIDTMCSDFSCFMEKENLRFLEHDKLEGTDHYVDSVTGWYTYHEFKSDVDFDTNYRKYKAGLGRRIDRFRAALNRGEKVLLVHFHGEGKYASELLLSCMERLRGHHPRARIDLLVLEHAGGQPDVCRELVGDGIVRVTCDYYDRSRFDAVMGNEKLVSSVLRRIRMRGKLRNLVRDRWESLKRRLLRRRSEKSGGYR